MDKLIVSSTKLGLIMVDKDLSWSTMERIMEIVGRMPSEQDREEKAKSIIKKIQNLKTEEEIVKVLDEMEKDLDSTQKETN